MFEDYAVELCRKCAAPYINRTVSTMITYDSRKKYDFKPFKKPDGKVYYYRKELDKYADEDLRPRKNKEMSK